MLMKVEILDMDKNHTTVYVNPEQVTMLTQIKYAMGEEQRKYHGLDDEKYDSYSVIELTTENKMLSPTPLMPLAEYLNQ